MYTCAPPVGTWHVVQVQDFTQAELLLDLKVCSDPNGMFYSGCSTVAVSAVVCMLVLRVNTFGCFSETKEFTDFQ